MCAAQMGSNRLTSSQLFESLNEPLSRPNEQKVAQWADKLNIVRSHVLPIWDTGIIKTGGVVVSPSEADSSTSIEDSNTKSTSWISTTSNASDQNKFIPKQLENYVLRRDHSLSNDIEEDFLSPTMIVEPKMEKLKTSSRFARPRQEAQFPSQGRLINSQRSKLVALFHNSIADDIDFAKLDIFQPRLFALGNAIEGSEMKQREWIQLSKHTDERWKTIVSLLESKTVMKEEIEQCKIVFSTGNKITKLQILANNQVLGAGGMVSSSGGIPFAENSDGDMIIEARTSTGSCLEIEREEAALYNVGIGTNLRHVCHADISLNSSHLVETHVKRPLNSYMLYRGAMIKVCQILSLIDAMTEIVEEIQDAYRGRIVNVLYSSEEQELYILRRINSIINDAAEKTATKFIDALNERLTTCVRVSHSSLGHVISALWQTESTETKALFQQFSHLEVENHQVMYPNYTYKPSKKQKR